MLLLKTFSCVYRFAGGRQPKQPIPPGDSAFFYHGLCVATSGFGDPFSNRKCDDTEGIVLKERSTKIEVATHSPW